jgi:hypothetical protein
VVRQLSRLHRRRPTGLALYHDIKVDQLLRQRRHVVLETKGVFAHGVGRQHIVALTFPLSVENDFFFRVFDVKVDVEGATRLHGKVELLERVGSVNTSLVHSSEWNAYPDLFAGFINIGIET